MGVRAVYSLSEFQNILKEAGKRLVVVDFHAVWCGPCKMIAPVMEELSNEFTAAIFLKVDVDQVRDIAGTYQIRAMPTFVFISEQGEIDRMQGASPGGLRTKIQNWVNYLGTAEPAVKNPKAANAAEKSWLQQFVRYTDQVQLYEDEISQTLARSLIPLEDYLAKVTVDGKKSDFQLAKMLMNWFHDDFFSWTDTPICGSCNKQTSAGTRSNGLPTDEEAANGAGRVEVYRCLNCNKEVRFPRYNNPIKLLETRNGRCGEWANCFALFCRAVGLETRFVVDNADHVWVEIWARELRRWVHCDPCEDIIDVPLLYEKGWNKQLVYVLAFAKDHIMDVTWRYTFNRQVTSKKRNKCRPLVFINFLNKLNDRLQKSLPGDRKKVLHDRYISELIEFIWPWNNLRKNSTENQGRSSGSEKWKTERGEAGSLPPITIKPTKKEIESKVFEITYDASKDEYTRPKDPDYATKHWQSQVFEVENVFRKIEKDWKKAYLARNEGAEKGVLVWKVDLAGLKIKEISVKATSFKTGSGSILAVACCGMQCVRLPGDGTARIDNVEEAEYLELRVELSGGNWQHAQAFRTDLSESEPGLRIRVELA
ncbi:hypothetical protein FO519_001817 [Halicephalobus sp. NKZ332]|nr:hypothetical protein FO519_001817 [Halicephalobus sp. NKZ332]